FPDFRFGSSLKSRSHQLCATRIVGGSGEIRLPIASNIDTDSAEFAANAARMRALADELQKRRAEAAAGGPPRIRERHVSRGKLLPRDRVLRLLDPGSPFLELSPLAANGLYDDAI